MRFHVLGSELRPEMYQQDGAEIIKQESSVFGDVVRREVCMVHGRMLGDDVDICRFVRLVLLSSITLALPENCCWLSSKSLSGVLFVAAV